MIARQFVRLLDQRLVIVENENFVAAHGAYVWF